MNYAIIGDVHSQLKPLEQAAFYCQQKGLTPILLGDLFDSRVATSDSVGVYRFAKMMEREMGATILRSNHQSKLERYAKGNKVFLSEDFQQTLKDFEQEDILVQEVAEWLETFPFGVVFKDNSGKEYRCAHAMFPRWIIVPSYEGLHKITQVTSKSKDAMIYGPRVAGARWPEQEDRVFWWERDTDREWIRVAGHYHTVYVGDKNLVLDGGCGGSCRSVASEENPDSLCLWDVDREELLQFPATPH